MRINTLLMSAVLTGLILTGCGGSSINNTQNENSEDNDSIGFRQITHEEGLALSEVESALDSMVDSSPDEKQQVLRAIDNVSEAYCEANECNIILTTGLSRGYLYPIINQ
jgi:hypothetical protein